MSGGEELHITSLVVHAAPRRTEGIAARLAELPGTQVHALSAERGKLVITIEAPSAAAVMAHIATIQHTEGVLSAAVVFQCADTLTAMNEEMPDGARTAQGLS